MQPTLETTPVLPDPAAVNLKRDRVHETPLDLQRTWIEHEAYILKILSIRFGVPDAELPPLPVLRDAPQKFRDCRKRVAWFLAELTRHAGRIAELPPQERADLQVALDLLTKLTEIWESTAASVNAAISGSRTTLPELDRLRARRRRAYEAAKLPLPEDLKARREGTLELSECVPVVEIAGPVGPRRVRIDSETALREFARLEKLVGFEVNAENVANAHHVEAWKARQEREERARREAEKSTPEKPVETKPGDAPTETKPPESPNAAKKAPWEIPNLPVRLRSFATSMIVLNCRAGTDELCKKLSFDPARIFHDYPSGRLKRWIAFHVEWESRGVYRFFPNGKPGQKASKLPRKKSVKHSK